MCPRVQYLGGVHLIWWEWWLGLVLRIPTECLPCSTLFSQAGNFYIGLYGPIGDMAKGIKTVSWLARLVTIRLSGCDLRELPPQVIAGGRWWYDVVPPVWLFGLETRPAPYSSYFFAVHLLLFLVLFFSFSCLVLRDSANTRACWIEGADCKSWAESNARITNPLHSCSTYHIKARVKAIESNVT